MVDNPSHSQPLPDILTQANKERFRRRLLISTRILAVLLIFSIVWIGFVQIKYVKEINDLKAKYGSNAWCYMCAKENYKQTSCYYPTAEEREKLKTNYTLREAIGDRLAQETLNLTCVLKSEVNLGNIKVPGIDLELNYSDLNVSS